MSQSFEYFGKYLLLEKLATGGMAEVFLARTTGAGGIGKFVAIKRILPQYAEAEEFIEMFKDEAKIAINLSHSNIVSLHEFGTQNNQFFIVMDYVEGRNLRQILNKMKKSTAKFGIDQIVFMVREVAAGLDHAHRSINGTTGKPLNITHRDMSPQNVMVSFEGEVKVVDFGIAKAEIQLETTRTGTLKGKFGYMSPEQAEGQKVDPRTDIFSLGIILWELLANDRLFLANNEINTLRKIRDCQVPSLKKINPNIPNELERITQKALARDRNLRYQNAAALYRDLNRFLNRQYPDFSSHDFSIFIKTLFAEDILNTRKRLVEYSQLQLQAGTDSRPQGVSEANQPEESSLSSLNTGSFLSAPSETKATGESTGTGPVTSSIPSISLGSKSESLQREHTFTESNIDFTQSQSEDPDPDATVPFMQNPLPSPQKPKDTEASKDLDNEGTATTGKTILDQTALTKSLASKLQKVGPKIQIQDVSTLRGPPSQRGKTSVTKKSASKSGFGLSQLVALLLGALTLYALAAKMAPEPMAPLVSQLDTYIKPFHELVGISMNVTEQASEQEPLLLHQEAVTPPQPTPAPTTPPAVTAQFKELVINSTPSGAEILINGRSTGMVTPSKVPVPSSGSFAITLKRTGYIDYESTRNMSSGGSSSFNATLQPAAVAYLDIDVRPPVNVTIFIDGIELKGESLPISRRMVPANTALEIRAVNRVNNRSARQRVQIEQNQHRSVILDLRDPRKRSPSGSQK